MAPNNTELDMKIISTIKSEFKRPEKIKYGQSARVPAACWLGKLCNEAGFSID